MTHRYGPVPGGPWGRIWIATLILAGLGLGGLETAWRLAGHVPSVVDSRDLWAYYRSRVYDPATVVLLGSSRMQLDFSTREFRERFPGRPVVQLAIDGSRPIATLRDLAADERFRGSVIVDISEDGLSRISRASQQEYVDHYRASQLDRRLNSRLHAFLQGRLAMLNPSADYTALLAAGRFPPRYYLTTYEDRSREADYSLSDLEAQRAFRIAALRPGGREPPRLAPDAWLRDALDVDSLATTIRERGGEVAFVVFPSSGESLEFNEARFPRERYWDRFAAEAGALTVHFQDHPPLSGFECPDTSHLDVRDVPRFTHALLDALVELGFFGIPRATRFGDPVQLLAGGDLVAAGTIPEDADPAEDRRGHGGSS